MVLSELSAVNVPLATAFTRSVSVTLLVRVASRVLVAVNTAGLVPVALPAATGTAAIRLTLWPGVRAAVVVTVGSPGSITPSPSRSR